MARKPTRAQPTAAPDDAADAQYPDWDADIGFDVDALPSRPRRAAEAPDAQADAAPVRSRLDGVLDALGALPAGDAGRTLKLALLDALEASTRADRITLPVEVQGLRARVRAGTL